MQKNKTTTFISLTADSVFKYLFKTKYKWFYREIIYKYTNIDISEYELYDNELNFGTKHNKGDLKLDIILKHKYSNNYLNIEMNNYNTLKRNEMYLHTLSVFLYNKQINNETKDMLNIIQININTFNNKAYRHISLKNESNKIVTKNFQFFNINVPKIVNKSYNKDNKLALLVCKNYDEMEKNAKGDVRLMGLIKKLKSLGRNDDFLKLYDPEEDMKFMINEVKNNSIEETQKNTVRNMQKEGLSIDKIKKYTGLSTSQIKNFML